MWGVGYFLGVPAEIVNTEKTTVTTTGRILILLVSVDGGGNWVRISSQQRRSESLWPIFSSLSKLTSCPFFPIFKLRQNHAFLSIPDRMGRECKGYPFWIFLCFCFFLNFQNVNSRFHDRCSDCRSLQTYFSLRHYCCCCCCRRRGRRKMRCPIASLGVQKVHDLKALYFILMYQMKHLATS